ncbi:recombinase family protein [Patescibacteria group bacterium]|nr:recombinase family protein [Patescibacteria group bacterium]MBP9709647.1 recombinase family protein [Patescibacteria group bacterium]
MPHVPSSLLSKIPLHARKRAQEANKPTTIKYCLYARKSSESEERQALSIDSQLNEMKQLIEREGLLVVQVLKESHSAKERGCRPVFNQMMNDIRAGKYNAIITWATDRLSRNAGDLGALVDLMDQEKLIEVRTHDQKFTNSPAEKFLLMILGSQAKLENDNRSVNVQRGMRNRVEMGLWPGVAPLGYLNQNRTDKRCEVITDPDRSPIIRQIFEKAAQGESIRKIYNWLGTIDFRTRGDKPLTYSGVQRLLDTPFYTGRYEYPRKSGKWHQGKHAPLITQEIFDKVREQMKRHQVKVKSKEFSFVKLFTCGLCGSGIGAQEKIKKLKEGVPARYFYYGCNRGKDRYCKNSYIRENELIEQLVEIFDTVDIDELGIRYKFEAEITRFGKFVKFALGQSMELKPEEVEVNIRGYAKYVLRDGTIPEKRELLSNIQSRLVYTNKKISLLESDIEHDA